MQTNKGNKIPSIITKKPQNNELYEFSGYNFFLPKVFQKKKGKDSEYQH